MDRPTRTPRSHTMASYGSDWAWEVVEQLVFTSRDEALTARIFATPTGTWTLHVHTTGWESLKDAKKVLFMVLYIMCDSHGYVLRHDEFNWQQLNQLRFTPPEADSNGAAPRRPGGHLRPGMPRVPFDTVFDFHKTSEEMIQSACGTLSARVTAADADTFHVEIESRQWFSAEQARDVFRMLAIPLLDNRGAFHYYPDFPLDVINHFGGGRLRSNAEAAQYLLDIARDEGLEPDDYEDIEEEDFGD